MKLKPHRRSTLIALAIAATALMLVAGFGWRAFAMRQQVAAAIPARPAAAPVPPALQDRLDLAEQRARRFRKPVEGLAELARLYHANGFSAEARAAYHGLMDLEADNPRWPHLLANVLAGYGQLDEAVPLLRRAIALAPDYLPARLRLGEALMKTNRPREAAIVYQMVLQRDPANSSALAGFTRAEIDATGSATDTRVNESKDEAMGDVPDPWLDELLFDCYDGYRLRVAAAATRDGSVALRLLERALEQAPEDASVHRQLGDLLARQGDRIRGGKLLQRAVQLGPKDADNWAYLLHFFDTVGDIPAGDAALTAGLSHCPQSPSLHLERGRRLQRAGNYEGALAAFERSRQLRPNDVDAYVEMSGVYFRLERVADGIAILRRALVVEPAHPVVLSALAFCAIGSGDEATARATLREARDQPRLPRNELDQLVMRFVARFGRQPW